MKNQNHELLTFLTFIVLIATGTVALKPPLVHHSHGVSCLDALFIATSAVCVTGLTTIPTSGFNFPGQIIILILIQIGAIGIMTFTVRFIFFRRELDFKNRMMATQLFVSPNLSNREEVLKDVHAELAGNRTKLTTISIGILLIVSLLSVYSIRQTMVADRERLGIFMERETLLKSLEESKDRYRNLIETTSDWIWESDGDGRYTYSSPKVKDVLGYLPEEIMNKTLLTSSLPSRKVHSTRHLRTWFAPKNLLTGCRTSVWERAAR